MEELEKYLNDNDSILKSYKPKNSYIKKLESNYKNKSIQNLKNITKTSQLKNESEVEKENEICHTFENVQNFLNINLENWRNQRKLQLKSFIEELEIDINIDNKNSILLQDLDVSNQYLESEMLNSFDNYRNNKSLKFNQILGEVASQMSTINEVCTKHQNNFQYQNLSSYENKNHNHSLSTSVFTSNSELLSTPINQISSKVENKFLNESLESNILNEIENHHNNNHNHNHYNHHLPSRLFRSTSPSTPPSPPPPIITTTTSFFQEKLKKETLDSPSNLKKDDIQNNQRKSLNSSTHFLVPGGLSTNRPLLSPLVSSKHRLFQEQNLNDKK